MAIIEFTTEELNSEIWKPIPDFEMYEISSLGRVRRATNCRASKKGRILKNGATSTGYLQVSLVKKNTYTRLVHRLVALAFLGEPPTPKHHVNHKDGDRQNARLSNLEYCTARENLIHSIEVLGHRRDGEHLGSVKLTNQDVLAIHDALMRGVAPSKIIAEFGVSETQLYRIKKRKTRKELLKDLPTDYPPSELVIKGSRVGTSKLTEDDVRQIKTLITQGLSNLQIASHFNVTDNAVQFIRLGQSWKHVTT